MEKLFDAVCGNLSYQELRDFYQELQTYYEKTRNLPQTENLYDYETLRAVVLRKLNGEIDDEYFTTWLIVVSWLLDNAHGDLSWALDGFSFCDSFDKKTVLRLLSTLKDFDYKLRHKDFIAAHEQEGLQVIYLRSSHCNRTENSLVYKAYFVDYKNKRFDVKMVDDAFFTFKDNLLFCDISYRKEELLEDGSYGVIQPYKTPEEEQLTSIFFGEDDWVCDHALTFDFDR